MRTRIKFRWIVVLVAFVAAFIGLSLSANTVKADEPGLLLMEDGASAKINEDGGIRFRAYMDEDMYDYVKDDGISLKCIIMPRNYFDNVESNDYVARASYVEGIIKRSVTVTADKEKIYEENGYYYVNFCVTTIATANRRLDYVALAYVTDGETVYYAETGSPTTHYAVGNANFSLNNVRGNICDILSQSVVDPSSDDFSKVFSCSAYNEWFGTADYPIQINNLATYNDLVDKVNGNTDFSGYTVYVSDAVDTASGHELVNDDLVTTTTSHTVKFYNGDKLIAKYVVADGEDLSAPSSPTKAATAKYTYSFSGWDIDDDGDTDELSDTVTESATYKAVFGSTVNKYTITWKDGDGNTIKTEDVEYDDTPSYSGATPTKTMTVDKVFTYNDGWAPAISSVTGEATYTATFNESARKYTITWKDDEGNTLKTEDVEYDDTPIAPTIERTDKVTTWSPKIQTVTGATEYRLVYKSPRYAGQIWDFSDSSIIRNDVKESAGRNYYVKYFDSYDGEEGVVAVTNTLTTDYNWDIWFLSGYTSFAESINDNADTLYIRLKVSAACKATLFGGGADVGNSLIMYDYNLPTSWTTIAITGDNFNHFKDYLAHYRGAFQAWMSSPVTLYVSDIYVGTSATVTNNGESANGNVITLNDNSATVFSGYSKLDCELKAPDNTFVTITNGKFTAEQEGNYTLTYYAVMPSGLLKTATYTINIISAKKSASIWDFDDSSIVANDVKESDNASYYVEYLDSYDGEEGVVAVTNKLSDWNWYIRFLSGYTSFAESINDNADTLYIRLKSTAACKITLFGGGADVGASLIMYEYTLPTSWTTIAITGDNFNHFKDYLAYYRGAFQAWMSSSATLYISDIYVGKSVTVTNNNSALTFGEVTIDDDSESVFVGYDKLDCEVKAPDNSSVTVTNGKFTPTVNGVYTVTYYAIMPSGVVKVGSYSITCLIKNDLGTFVPSAADWAQQGGSTFTTNVVDGYAEHITNVDTAAYTNFSSVRNYMAANSISTVKIRFDFISGGKISIGKISGGVNNFEFGDTDGSGRYFAAGDYYELTLNMSDYERVYCQIIWTACEFVVTYEFIS